VPVTPRLAATIILLRGGAQTLEVLLVLRTSSARFMPGAWVFPGGAVEPDEDERTAAVRELGEEAGITVPDGEALVLFSRWITPSHMPIRFDTHFFLAAAPSDAQVVVDGSETVDHCWITPQAALELHEADELLLVLPTLTQLGRLSGFASSDELLAYADGREVVAVQPRVGVGEKARILLPGDPGDDDA